MKIRHCATLIVLFTAITFPSSSRAMSMGIGFNTWYNWWDAYWNELEMEDDNAFSIEPAFLYGPLISLRITPKWSLSSLFLMGCYNANYTFTYNSFTDTITKNVRYKIWRYDSDTAASYAFSDNLSLYFGFKYLRFNYKYENYYLENPADSSSAASDNYTYIINDFAAGIGVIFVVNLVERLYMSFSFGLLLSYSQVLEDGKEIFAYGTDTFTKHDEFTMASIGANSKVALTYDIARINTLFSIGFRYQVIYLYPLSGNYYYHIDHLYGIDATVIYHFDIGPSKSRNTAQKQAGRRRNETAQK